MSDSLYDEQLSAAKFRAERDQARQELDRVREEMEEMRRRLMPEGCEWPRYEDGDPVRFGDVGLDVHGKRRKCYGVKFTNFGFTFVLDDMGRAWWANDCGPLEDPEIDPGERVKRPQVLAADGEPLEVGQTVWMTEPPYSQHIVRDLHGGHANFVDAISADYPVSKLTHQRPVLDADGVPIKVGDTVHILGEPDEYTVTAVDTGFIEVEFHGSGLVFDEKGLTHTKPEQDSLERIEADAETLVYGAAQDAFHGLEFRDELRKGIGDIMRRCKELAGASE